MVESHVHVAGQRHAADAARARPGGLEATDTVVAAPGRLHRSRPSPRRSPPRAGRRRRDRWWGHRRGKRRPRPAGRADPPPLRHTNGLPHPSHPGVPPASPGLRHRPGPRVPVVPRVPVDGDRFRRAPGDNVQLQIAAAPVQLQFATAPTGLTLSAVRTAIGPAPFTYTAIRRGTTRASPQLQALERSDLRIPVVVGRRFAPVHAVQPVADTAYTATFRAVATATIAADRFGRTVVDGWGAATTGRAYSSCARLPVPDVGRRARRSHCRRRPQPRH